MVFVKSVVSVSILSLILAYLMYQPLPEEIEQPGIYRAGGVFYDILTLCSKIPATLFGWHFDLQRYVTRILMPIVYPDYPDLEVHDLKFGGVPVRVYKSKSLESLAPAVVHIHGGGWVFQSVDSYDAVSVRLALNTSMVVVAVEYRLAPENPYPAAFEDCLEATKYVLKHGQTYGIDVHRVAIAGDSSGGNLATSVALKLSQEKSDSLPALKLQVLIYPVTQVINFRTSSYLLYKDFPILNQRYMATYVASYLLQDLRTEVVTAIMENRHISPNIRNPVYKDYFKEENIPKYVRQNSDKEHNDPPNDNVNDAVANKMDILALNPYVSPLLAQNLSQLPRTYVTVCEFDVLRDDGFLYIRRLREAGVDVALSFVKDQPHTFMAFGRDPNLLYSRTVPEWDKIYRFLKRNLGNKK